MCNYYFVLNKVIVRLALVIPSVILSWKPWSRI